MSDPLSVLASVAGVVAVGAKLSRMLYTTINRVGSVPQTVVSLSRELETLCKALGYLETIFRDHDLSAYPQFPADLLLDLLDSIMVDFKNFEEILCVHAKQPGEGLWRSV
ncbi:uncharacterized protein H6S33_007087 [Morchella sextelata]|uniref:uncharacterized protein n=1 Tax=Morchella sextelata TaxID=1174677 RepID=UPI001D042BDA|nr:uncharacterized protein H6S33_007087 [Morchella sextelata]KAH0604056.1 hypothetical protein H6S33_007087 [Morchella sextelata]